MYHINSCKYLSFNPHQDIIDQAKIAFELHQNPNMDPGLFIALTTGIGTGTWFEYNAKYEAYCEKNDSPCVITVVPVDSLESFDDFYKPFFYLALFSSKIKKCPDRVFPDNNTSGKERLDEFLINHIIIPNNSLLIAANGAHNHIPFRNEVQCNTRMLIESKLS